MTDTYLISSQPKDKSFAENREVDLIKRNGNINKNYAYTQALICKHCNSAVIAELEPKGLTITIYDFRERKVKHRHSADIRTRVMVLERIETEKRLLEDIEPGDYVYL
jgi:hypothetical protein